MSFFSFVRPVIELFPRVASVYRGLRDQWQTMEEPVLTPWGFKLAGNQAMAQGDFEPAETKLVRKLLKDVDVLVNVGANVGFYCCHALSMGKEVIAFEPMQGNLRYLYKNIKVNGWSGVEIYPIALSNEVNILEIWGGGTGASLIKGWADTPENYKTLVPSSTMDKTLGARLQGKNVLIIVDIEGAEYLMLQGAIRFLQMEPKPTWVVEITTNDNQPDSSKINPNLESTFNMFLCNGYQAFTANNELRPVFEEEIKMVASREKEFEVHNFVFMEARTAL